MGVREDWKENVIHTGYIVYTAADVNIYLSKECKLDLT